VISIAGEVRAGGLARRQCIDWESASRAKNISTESTTFVARARLKFLSIEPLLAPLGKVNLRGIDWVIVGGESGPGARPMNAEWVTDIRDQCLKANVAFFFKQWGGVQKKKAGRKLEGRTWDEMPELVTI
jgi:protein gp37